MGKRKHREYEWADSAVLTEAYEIHGPYPSAVRFYRTEIERQAEENIEL